MKGRDTLDMITAELVAAIEAGAGEWKMPWHHDGGSWFPRNAVTGKPYRGMNIMQLLVAQMKHGFTSSQWATYKAWSSVGGQVRKGERGTPCVYWARKETVDAKTDDVSSWLIPIGFTLHNADQQDGWTAPDAAPPAVPTLVAAAEWFRAIPATIHTGSPAYWPTSDKVTMPPLEAFDTEQHYWGTLAHELTHWTGHTSRLNRQASGDKANPEYAIEELVAELGAAFTCGLLDIPTVDRSNDHATYLAGWLSVLKADPGVLFTVASSAQKAVDHLWSYQPKEDVQHGEHNEDQGPARLDHRLGASQGGRNGHRTRGHC